MRRQQYFVWFLVFGLSTILITGTVHAQQKKPAVVGIVYLESAQGKKSPLAKATVELKLDDKLIKRAITDTKGRFAVFAELKNGTYTVAATFGDHKKTVEFDYKGKITKLLIGLPDKE